MDDALRFYFLGGDPFSPSSQVFLCPWDVEEGEVEDEGRIPAGAVRLDEVIQNAGEILSYAYDYGDGWELALRLENVLPAAARPPSAVAQWMVAALRPRRTAGAAGPRRSWRRSLGTYRSLPWTR